MVCHPTFPKPIQKTVATPEAQVNSHAHIQEEQVVGIIGLGRATAGLPTAPAPGRAHGQWCERHLAPEPSSLCFLTSEQARCTPENPCYSLFPHSYSLKNKKGEIT